MTSSHVGMVIAYRQTTGVMKSKTVQMEVMRTPADSSI